MIPTLRWMLTAGVVAVGLVVADAPAAKAQGPGYGGFGHGGYGGGAGNYGGYGGAGNYGGGAFQTRPVYHPPSVHYDQTYHPTRTHWAPFRGVHTHGHYDVTPHYTPGHLDTQHGGHIDPNPYFHHR